MIARGLDSVPSVRAAIEAVGYSTSAPENLIASVERYVHVVEIVLTGIGVIALAIASLGIMNAMLAAVRERRREIGILKAVGARDRDVLRSFLIEAAVMGAVGGIIGTVLGLALARLVAAIVDGYLTSQGLAGVHVSTPYLLAVATVVGATVLAVVAGAIPARRAARPSRTRGGRAVTVARRVRRGIGVRPRRRRRPVAGCGAHGADGDHAAPADRPRHAPTSPSAEVTPSAAAPTIRWSTRGRSSSSDARSRSTTVFVNAAVPGSTVAAAITDQAPLADLVGRHRRHRVARLGRPARRHPGDDLRHAAPAAAHDPPRRRATTVLVGNVPPLDQLPGLPGLSRRCHRRRSGAPLSRPHCPIRRP